MANICSNWVEIQGDSEQVKQFVELVGEEFDFNKVIPIEDSSAQAREHWNCSSIAFDTKYDGDLGGDCPVAYWEFWTKWNPPTLIYQKLSELFPDVYMVWRYEEPGCGLYGYLNTEEY